MGLANAQRRASIAHPCRAGLQNRGVYRALFIEPTDTGLFRSAGLGVLRRTNHAHPVQGGFAGYALADQGQNAQCIVCHADTATTNKHHSRQSQESQSTSSIDMSRTAVVKNDPTRECQQEGAPLWTGTSIGQ